VLAVGCRTEENAAVDAPPDISPDTPTVSRHRARELRTIEAMVRIYCADHHGSAGAFCDDCAALFGYASRRLLRCVFGDDKPTCANCTVHCYSAPMRARVRDVMRYAGPRMLARHPVLAIAHMLDGRRPAPGLASRRRSPEATPPARASTPDPSTSPRPEDFPG
jgi:hypothetical protein